MPLLFDHAIVLINNLPSAINDYRDLGFTVKENSTSSASIQFVNGTSIELVTADELKRLELKTLVQKQEGFVGYALRSDDLDAEIIRLQKAGFKVRKLAPVEYRLHNGQVRQQNRVIVEDKVSPILIETAISEHVDVPQHANRAVGLSAVEIVVREMEASWDKYTKLIGQTPRSDARNYRTVSGIVLNELMLWASTYDLDELPAHLRMFAGNVTQSEIDAANGMEEPNLFKISRQVEAETLKKLRADAEYEKAMKAALGKSSEALFSLHLVREHAATDDFKVEKTHGVYFEQFTGVPPTRGEKILRGLDRVDWKRVHHAYGPAIDVPDLLRALASDDKTVRDDAHRIMEGNIIHQGTVYEASIETIPFLMQLLDSPDVFDKYQLLYLLEGIVFGGDYEPSLRERTHTLLRDALPVYLRALNSPESKIREMVAEHLVLYKNQLAEVEPHLREKIISDSEVAVRAACLRTLFALWAGEVSNEVLDTLSVEQVDLFAALLRDPDQAMEVKYQAATALIKANSDLWLDEGLSIFYRMMQHDAYLSKMVSDGWVTSIFYSVVQTLADYPEKALEWVAAQAEHPMAEVREHVATAFNQMRQTTRLESAMLPTMKLLLRDTSPDVRQSAVGFFYFNPQAHEVVDMLEAIAANDPSLQIRTVARNTLNMLPPKPAK
jgi:hypothetical protein